MNVCLTLSISIYSYSVFAVVLCACVYFLCVLFWIAWNAISFPFSFQISHATFDMTKRLCYYFIIYLYKYKMKRRRIKLSAKQPFKFLRNCRESNKSTYLNKYATPYTYIILIEMFKWSQESIQMKEKEEEKKTISNGTMNKKKIQCHNWIGINVEKSSHASKANQSLIDRMRKLVEMYTNSNNKRCRRHWRRRLRRWRWRRQRIKKKYNVTLQPPSIRLKKVSGCEEKLLNPLGRSHSHAYTQSSHLIIM